MIKRGDADVILYGGARGSGKALCNQSLTLTSKGFKKHGDLTLDDKVIDPTTGKPISILQIHPTYMQKAYKVVFADGSHQICSADHLWLTRRLRYRYRDSSKDRGSYLQGDDNYRVENTLKIKEWAGKANNPSTKRKCFPVIPLPKPLEFDNGFKPTLDPYLLGILLGDGTLTKTISVTNSEPEIDKFLKTYDPLIRNSYNKISKEYLFRFNQGKTLKKQLEDLDLRYKKSSNKFIPKDYLNSKLEYRLALLNGLLDTDGTVSERGHLSFCSTSQHLAEGVKYLIDSLGGFSKIFKYESHDKKCVSKYYYKVDFRHNTPEKLFTVSRKKDRIVSKEKNYKKIVDVIELTEDLPMRCITVDSKDGLFVCGETFSCTHNSELMTMIPLIFNHDKHFRGIFFRRQYDELMGGGGLWHKASNMYPLFNAKANISSKTWTFPSGAKQQFSHMFTENDKESHRGKGYSFISFDEVNQFSKEQVTFLMTCLRSEADMNSFCLMSMNPDPDSWVLPLVEFYLDSNGNPDPDKIGLIRHFVVKDGDFVFGDSEEYFKENHPESVYVINRLTGEKLYIRPKRFTFIAANIFDNPALIEANPAYLSELQNLPEHEREKELWGNWYARAKGANYLQRDWLHKADKIPDGSITVNAYDKAYTEPSEKNRYPDYTACVKISKCPNDEYYISGDWNPDLKDPEKHNPECVIGRYRVRAGQRNQWMLNQAYWDGEDVTIVIPEESGAGRGEGEELTKMFTNAGFKVQGAKTGNSKGAKMKRFSTFAAACQNGLVHILEDTFHNEATLNAFYKELEAFTGERSTATIKDDWVDCCSDAFLALQKTQVFTVPNIPRINAPTRLHNMRTSTRR